MDSANNGNAVFTIDFGVASHETIAGEDKYLTLDQYIEAIKSIESENSFIANNTRLMLTKLRKVFYNSRGWNDILIPGTASVSAFSDGAAVKSLSRNHEIILRNKQRYDAAHIFAILDASNNNGSFSPLPSVLLSKLPDFLSGIVPVVHDRLAAAGWLGDLSEVIGQCYQRKAATVAEKQKVIDEFCAYYKNLANIDAMILTESYNLSASDNGPSISSIFLDYYGAAPAQGLRETLKTQRCAKFAASIGLKWSAAGFTNKHDWINEQIKNLRTCAAFYLVKDRGLNLDIKQDLKADLKADINAALQHSLLNELEKQFVGFLLDAIEKKTDPLESDLETLILCFLMWKGVYDEKLSIRDILVSYVECLGKAIDEESKNSPV